MNERFGGRQPSIHEVGARLRKFEQRIVDGIPSKNAPLPEKPDWSHDAVSYMADFVYLFGVAIPLGATLVARGVLELFDSEKNILE